MVPDFRQDDDVVFAYEWGSTASGRGDASRSGLLTRRPLLRAEIEHPPSDLRAGEMRT